MSSNPKRVVITGLGIISALGLNQAEFWQSLATGRSGITPLPAYEQGPIRFRNAAIIQGYERDQHFPDKNVALMDRAAQLAVVAVREAVTQSGLQWTDELRATAAIVTGCCMGGRAVEEVGYWEMYHHGKPRVNPLTIPLSMESAGASHISIEYGIQGPTYTVSTACSSSAHAIGQAFWMVRSGNAPLALAGGSEAPLFFGGLKAWEAMRVVSPDTCRPFSADRTGMVLGEAGAMLVLEPLEAALARGAKPIAEIVGFGMSSDASHMTQPSPEGAARAMRAALNDAGLAPEQIGYVNAHGTATEANDRVESAAIRLVFGPYADNGLAVSSTKSMHAHTFGAAGAVEAVATTLALQNGILPPTINFNKVDPACGLDIIPNEARPVQVETALSNSFAFGGLNAVLAFKTYR
jgi:nodulation protein E